MPRFAPAHVVLAAYTAGLCMCLARWPLTIALLAVALPTVVLGAILMACRRRRAVRLAALAGLLLAAGLLVGAGRLAVVRQSVLRPLLYESVPVRVTVLDLPRGDERRVQVMVQVTSVAGRRVAERAELELKRGDGDPPGIAAALVEGTMLEIPRTRLEPLPEPKRGAFDYARYLERRGEHVVLAAPLSSARVVGRRERHHRAHRSPASGGTRAAQRGSLAARGPGAARHGPGRR